MIFSKKDNSTDPKIQVNQLQALTICAVLNATFAQTEVMMWTIVTPIIISIFGLCYSINEEKVSKVTCALSRFNYADIFKETPTNPIKLSKSLFQQC